MNSVKTPKCCLAFCQFSDLVDPIEKNGFSDTTKPKHHQTLSGLSVLCSLDCIPRLFKDIPPACQFRGRCSCSRGIRYHRPRENGATAVFSAAWRPKLPYGPSFRRSERSIRKHRRMSRSLPNSCRNGLCPDCRNMRDNRWSWRSYPDFRGPSWAASILCSGRL